MSYFFKHCRVAVRTCTRSRTRIHTCASYFISIYTYGNSKLGSNNYKGKFRKKIETGYDEDKEELNEKEN